MEVIAVLSALKQYIPTVAQATADKLIADCQDVYRTDDRSNRAGVTTETIIHFIHAIGRSLGNVRNPAGVILTQVPLHFAGPAYDEFLKEHAAQAESAKRRTENAVRARQREAALAEARRLRKELNAKPTPWSRISEELQKRLSPSSYATWFRDAAVERQDNGVLFVWLPSRDHLAGVAKYEAELVDARKAAGVDLEIEFVYDDEELQSRERRHSSVVQSGQPVSA